MNFPFLSRPFCAAKPALLLFLAAPLSVPLAEAGGATFHDREFAFAEGFNLSVAAPPSLTSRPIEACFDNKGRLLVTESSGSNDPVAKQVKERPHRILRLTDSDGDGLFDQKTVFADQLMFPEGILWLDGSVYVAAPPQIWKLTDADDDGVAERREVWFDGKTLSGCANDLHGPYLGPDGLIYWCKGGFAAQTFDLAGKPGWSSRASHVFRARPDGTGLESVFTAGMDNPVGLAWTPEGDLMVSGTFLQHPGAGRRDGIIHAVRGGVWGKDHDVLQGHPRTGALMPPMTHLGPAAAASMCRYDRDLLVCQFNLRTVSRHHLIPEGATYRTEDSPLLVSEHPDFHPTDVLQAPDGSILVVDTGGWYKLCCPTSQLAKPDVPGAIYRLRRTAGEIPPTAPAPQWSLPPDFRESLNSPNLQLRRLALEAAGQAPGRQATPGAKLKVSQDIVPLILTSAAAAPGDRFLEHAATYALLEGGDPDTMAQALATADPHGKRLLVYALAQAKPDAASGTSIAALLPAADESLLEALVFAFAQVPDWKKAAADWLAEHLAGQPEAIASRLIGSFSVAAPDLLPDAGRLLQNTTAPGLRVKLLTAMRHMAQKADWPVSWGEPLLQSLRSGAGEEGQAAAAFFSDCKTIPTPDLTAALAEYCRNPSHPGGFRGLILANPLMAEAARENFPLLLAHLTPDTAPDIRLQTAKTISRLSPDPAQLKALTKVLGQAGLLERPLLLRAWRDCTDGPAGELLLDQLEPSGALRALPEALLKEALGHFPEAVLARAMAARNAGGTDRAAQLQRLTELENTLPPGDATRGSILFLGAKAACVLCHAIGYKGGTLGPDLSKTGAVRTRRDLLEAVLYPSASFVRSYEPVEVELKDRSRSAGLIRNQGTDSITLATSAASLSQVIPLDSIQSLTPGQTSLMPGAFGQILDTAELADLMAYLQSLK
jgi:putative heme-binding domain-containing protein